MKPIISIIVTSYNIEKYISACLDGLINQTITDIEIIVVDDGSTDRTPEIITEYASIDKRIIPVLNKENSIGGVATPANVGIGLAKGKYIGFADGDDLYDPGMFQALYLAAERNDASMSICAYKEMSGELNELKAPFDPAWEVIKELGCIDTTTVESKKKVLELQPVPWRKLYKASLLKDNEILFPVGPYFFEDNGFHWFTTLSSTKVAIVNETLCFNRKNRVGQSTASDGNRLLGVFHQHSVIWRFLSEKKLLADYRDYSLNWLGVHLSWVQQVISPTYFDEFYKTLVPHFDLYTHSEIRHHLSNKYYDRKSVELIVSVLRKDCYFFCEIMNGKVSTSYAEKVKFNLFKLGPCSFIWMVFRVMKTKLVPTKKINNDSAVNELILANLNDIQEQLSELRCDLNLANSKIAQLEISCINNNTDVNYSLLAIGHKVSEVERLIENKFSIQSKP